jgi:hypothetical protein
MKYTLVLIGLFFSIQAFAQRNTVTGIITDAQTKEPIAFANVFFATTRIGVSSDENGKFFLSGFPSGKYDLTITFVGYNTYQQSLEFNDSEYKLTVSLTENEIRLSEIIVKEDTTGWAENYEIFKKNFLGETKNSKDCKILNPRDIHLYFDRKTNSLVAHARVPIQIENLALGFKIDYYLHSFELNFREGKLVFMGIPAFQNLSSEKQSVQHRWEKERSRAYFGSIMHFIRSLRSDSLQENGFEVRKFYRVPNPERPPKKVLNAKIKELRVQNEGIKKGRIDSLDYYLNFLSKPELVDSVGKELLSGSEILNIEHEIIYKGILKVDFKKQKEEAGYPPTVGRTAIKWQTSFLHILIPSIKLFENGYYDGIQNVFMENYWGWSEKISNMLPYDYYPEPFKRKRDK